MTGEKRIQRIQQACRNCRRKKIRCSGTKPTCDFCQRLSQSCSYSDPESDGRPAKRHRGSGSDEFGSWKWATEQIDDEIRERWLGMEARMAGLEKSMDRLAAALEGRFAGSPPTMQSSSSAAVPVVKRNDKPSEHNGRQTASINLPTHSNLPPLDTVMSAAAVYFQCCHNQPYSLFHEDSFKAKLATGQLPHHLVFAILASAARHSSDISSGNKKEIIANYSMESWKALLLPWNGIEDRMGISIVQTILLLAIIDYTDGRTQGAWLKVGLGIRIIQDFGLMREPDPNLPVTEQEERRRIFWSFYICDKLMSCGREKPLAMLDENCKVNLPCDEHEFRSGKPWPKTPTLHEITHDLNCAESANVTPLSPYSMAVKMASILGQCTHYALGEYQSSVSGSLVPWSPTSTLSAINSALLQIESDFGLNNALLDVIRQTYLREDGSIDGHPAAPLFFARTLFHLCHCLLRHPIVFRRRLFSHGGRAPLSFIVHALDTCRNHARSLVTLIREVRELNCPTLSPLFDPFYGYCIMVAGTIHSLFLHSRDSALTDESQVYLESCLQMLAEQSTVWKNSSFIEARLNTLHGNSAHFARFLNPNSPADELSQIDITEVLEALDYGRLSTPLKYQSRDVFCVSSLPSPVFDDFLNLFPLGYTRPFENSMNDTMTDDLAPLSNELLNPYLENQTALGDFDSTYA